MAATDDGAEPDDARLPGIAAGQCFRGGYEAPFEGAFEVASDATAACSDLAFQSSSRGESLKSDNDSSPRSDRMPPPADEALEGVERDAGI